jgi:PadR family transcriptional regulator PadR
MTADQQSRDLFPGALELMILQTLHRMPMHGYALAQHIKAASDDLLQIEEGSLYPAQGWVAPVGDGRLASEPSCADL